MSEIVMKSCEASLFPHLWDEQVVPLLASLVDPKEEQALVGVLFSLFSLCGPLLQGPEEKKSLSVSAGRGSGDSSTATSSRNSAPESGGGGEGDGAGAGAGAGAGDGRREDGRRGQGGVGDGGGAYIAKAALHRSASPEDDAPSAQGAEGNAEAATGCRGLKSHLVADMSLTLILEECQNQVSRGRGSSCLCLFVLVFDEIGGALSSILSSIPSLL